MPGLIFRSFSNLPEWTLSTIAKGFLAAESSDGVIEAMESDDGLVIAVQWHPERDFTGPLILQGLISKFFEETV